MGSLPLLTPGAENLYFLLAFPGFLHFSCLIIKYDRAISFSSFSPFEAWAQLPTCPLAVFIYYAFFSLPLKSCKKTMPFALAIS
jgi:hypothetical protein